MFLEISWFAALNGRGDGSGRTLARSCPHVLAIVVLGWRRVKGKESTHPFRDKHYQGWKEMQGWWFCNALCQQGNATVYLRLLTCLRPGCRSLSPAGLFPPAHK